MDSGGEDQCPHVAQFIHIIIGGGGVSHTDPALENAFS